MGTIRVPRRGRGVGVNIQQLHIDIGQPGDPVYCGIALVLRQMFPGMYAYVEILEAAEWGEVDPDIEVDTACATLYRPSPDGFDRWVCELQAGIDAVTFIREFDAGNPNVVPVTVRFRRVA